MKSFSEPFELTELRKRAVFYSRLSWGIIVATLVIMLTTQVGWYFLFGLPAIVTALIYSHYEKRYKEGIKLLTVREIFEKYFSNVTYDVDDGFTSEQVALTDIFQMGDHYETNDLVRGTYNGVNFSRSDVNTWSRRQVGKRSIVIEYFVGQVFEFDFYKSIPSILKILNTNFSIMKRNSSGLGFEKIEFEDDMFNSAFKSYTTNAQNAYYIMTPHYIEEVKKLNEILLADFVLLFKDNKVYIALFNQSDGLEPKISNGLDHKYIEEIEESVTQIMNIISILELENQYFQKGANNE